MNLKKKRKKKEKKRKEKKEKEKKFAGQSPVYLPVFCSWTVHTTVVHVPPGTHPQCTASPTGDQETTSSEAESVAPPCRRPWPPSLWPPSSHNSCAPPGWHCPSYDYWELWSRQYSSMPIHLGLPRTPLIRKPSVTLFFFDPVRYAVVISSNWNSKPSGALHLYLSL